MKFAYADPPYIGQARKHYGKDAREVNHEILINTLCNEYEAWALSLSSSSVRQIQRALQLRDGTGAPVCRQQLTDGRPYFGCVGGVLNL
ncbi:hypothetical protein LCGC14_1858790 [marine sediment metagenome]|uniref:Uncharacterized protein n=1 Tax=marine sediment metagenome TaxID=412755 RepID=A0A0F9IMJ4_9ZZZZ